MLKSTKKKHQVRIAQCRKSLTTLSISVCRIATYRVEVTADPRTCDGEPADGTIDPTTRVIELRASLDRDQRRLTLRHEVAHGFDIAFPGARDIEDQCDFAASVNESLDRQMDLADGWAVLDRMYELAPFAAEQRKVAAR